MLSAAAHLGCQPSTQFHSYPEFSGASYQLRTPAPARARQAHAVTRAAAAPAARERATNRTWAPTTSSQDSPSISGSQDAESHDLVTFESFDQMLADSELPVLVDFQAPWCGPCQMMEPVVKKLSKQLKGAVTCEGIDCDKNPALASRYRVQALPTLVLFKDGKLIDKIEGYMSLQSLSDRVNYYLGRRMGPGRRFTPTGTIDLGYPSVSRKQKKDALATQESAAAT